MKLPPIKNMIVYKNSIMALDEDGKLWYLSERLGWYPVIDDAHEGRESI